MQRANGAIPQHRHHRGRGQGYVRIDGRQLYTGRWGTPEAEAKYDRTINQWLANGRRLPDERRDGSQLRVADLVAEYWARHVTSHYVKHGRATGEQENIRIAVRPLVALFGEIAPDKFTPLDLDAYRTHLIARGLSRTTINQRVGIIRRMFKWGVSQLLVETTTLQALQALQGLQKGRTAAREPSPVKPVAEEHVRVILELVSPQVAAMVELQWVTGMRPGEVVSMRMCDIETAHETWIYRPASHKTQHLKPEKGVALGRRAREIVRAFANNDPVRHIFSPREAEDARAKTRRELRQTPVQPSQRRRGALAHKNPRRSLGTRYSTQTYGRAIARACEAAGIPHWTPNQIRHSVATRLLDEHDLKTAQIVLGHADPKTTLRYAEGNMRQAMQVMETFD